MFQVLVHLSYLAETVYSALVTYLKPMQEKLSVLSTGWCTVQEYLVVGLLGWRGAVQDRNWETLESYPALETVQTVWCNLSSPLSVSRDVIHLATLFVLWLCYSLYGHQFGNSRELKRKISLGFWVAMLKNPISAVLGHNVVILSVPLYASAKR